uniref:Uncharacterized protein n=1 Tax=Lepeophtheirus salmonis TaxID=72036 RepID=A0A0K2U9L7_LEPSM
MSLLYRWQTSKCITQNVAYHAFININSSSSST